MKIDKRYSIVFLLIPFILLAWFGFSGCVSRKVCKIRAEEAKKTIASQCLSNQKSVELFYQSEINVKDAKIGELQRELKAKTDRLRKFNQVDLDGNLRALK